MTNTLKMPIVFIGHGSQMNAIEDNEFCRNWTKLAREIPQPKAILSISAHWYTNGTLVNNNLNPKMIYDMVGFPDELYQVKYPAKGNPELAKLVQSLVSKEVKVDNSWGYDHGTWSVLVKMFPQADIPLIQLSIDRNASAEVHFKIGQELSVLRDQGVLILGSGNVVHNLSRIDWNMQSAAYPWAVSFDAYIKDKIMKREFEDIIHYDKAGDMAKLSIPTPDHFLPLLYVLGASLPDDKLTIINEACMMGSMSMTCYLFG